MFLEKRFQKEFLGEGKSIVEDVIVGGLETVTELTLSSLLSSALT
jgi:hypothetical protein